MWAVGVIFYQMIFGQRPMGHNRSQKDILLNNSTILNSDLIEFPTTNSSRVSEEAKQFIRDCLQRNPKDRPDPLNCLQTHPYFNKIKRK